MTNKEKEKIFKQLNHFGIEYHKGFQDFLEEMVSDGKDEDIIETNLEHYKDDILNLLLSDFDIGSALYKIYNEKKYFCDDSSISNEQLILNWLCDVYEPPKYKLSKFEIDLLKNCIEVKGYENSKLNNFWIVEGMQQKGYFKDVNLNLNIKDVLYNCELLDCNISTSEETEL